MKTYEFDLKSKVSFEQTTIKVEASNFDVAIKKAQKEAKKDGWNAMNSSLQYWDGKGSGTSIW